MTVIAVVIAAVALAPLGIPLVLLALGGVRRPPPARAIDGRHVEELVRDRLYGPQERWKVEQL
jgi:hypothetical protein